MVEGIAPDVVEMGMKKKARNKAMKEKWKMIDGYPGYKISNNGRVVSYKRKKERFMSLCLDKDGYYRVALIGKDKRRFLPVHRLVAKAFHGDNGLSLVVDHIDSNRLNNHISNLRWVTVRENTTKGIARCGLSEFIGAKGSMNPMSKFNEDEILEIRYLYSSGLTQRALADAYGTTKKHIYQIISRKRWRHI